MLFKFINLHSMLHAVEYMHRIHSVWQVLAWVVLEEFAGLLNVLEKYILWFLLNVDKFKMCNWTILEWRFMQ